VARGSEHVVIIVFPERMRPNQRAHVVRSGTAGPAVVAISTAREIWSQTVILRMDLTRRAAFEKNMLGDAAWAIRRVRPHGQACCGDEVSMTRALLRRLTRVLVSAQSCRRR